MDYQDKDTYEFIIAGLPYKLKSSHNEDVVAQLVHLVDQRIREALSVTKSGSIQNASVLAALNIAEDYILLKKQAQWEIQSLLEKVHKWNQELIKLKTEVSKQESSV
jgi:cell division protein ZapA